MKKVFGLLFVAGLFTFASCAEGETTTETETVETTVEETPVMEDTTSVETDTTATPVDSTIAQ